MTRVLQEGKKSHTSGKEEEKIKKQKKKESGDK